MQAPFAHPRMGSGRGELANRGDAKEWEMSVLLGLLLTFGGQLVLLIEMVGAYRGG